METYGIKETRDLLQAFVGLANVIDVTTQDGFQFTDFFELIGPLSKMPAAITGAEKIPLELYDLDEEEEKILIQDIEQLEFESEYSELVAEQGLKAVKEFAKLIVVITMARNSKDIQEIYDFLKEFFK